MVVLPLRRLSSGGGQTHPEGELHPWDELKIGEKRSSSKAGSFLTNGFFFKCFCKAVEQTGGTVDFREDEMFDYKYNEDWQHLSDVP